MTCDICGGGDFADYAGRSAVLCRACGSLERHRAFVKALAGELVPRGSARCLEVAPRSPTLYGGWLRARGWEYTSLDKWEHRGRTDAGSFGFIDRAGDLTDLGWARSRSF